MRTCLAQQRGACAGAKKKLLVGSTSVFAASILLLLLGLRVVHLRVSPSATGTAGALWAPAALAKQHALDVRTAAFYDAKATLDGWVVEGAAHPILGLAARHTSAEAAAAAAAAEAVAAAAAAAAAALVGLGLEWNAEPPAPYSELSRSAERSHRAEERKRRALARNTSATMRRNRHRGEFVTAVSANRFKEVVGLVASVQRFLPDSQRKRWAIVVYELRGDLRSWQRRELRSWCNVRLVQFNWTKYPALDAADPKRLFLANSAWKPLIIAEAFGRVPPGGYVAFVDPSQRVTAPIASFLQGRVRLAGFVSRATDGPASKYTHAAMIGALGRIVPTRVARYASLRAYDNVPSACGCVSFWRVSEYIESTLLAPWVACALERECIMPTGASGFKEKGKGCHPGYTGRCHRGDQSALSILAFSLFGGETTRYLSEHLPVKTERSSSSGGHPQECT